jgi:hypothetical protein
VATPNHRAALMTSGSATHRLMRMTGFVHARQCRADAPISEQRRAAPRAKRGDHEYRRYSNMNIHFIDTMTTNAQSFVMRKIMPQSRMPIAVIKSVCI